MHWAFFSYNIELTAVSFHWLDRLERWNDSNSESLLVERGLFRVTKYSQLEDEKKSVHEMDPNLDIDNIQSGVWTETERWCAILLRLATRLQMQRGGGPLCTRDSHNIHTLTSLKHILRSHAMNIPDISKFSDSSWAFLGLEGVVLDYFYVYAQ